MADILYFSRDTKLFVEIGSAVWEMPVLDGFSFSQGSNSTEVTLAEMESSTGVSRRGRAYFNDSLAPAEWSFSTYVRPFKSAGTGPGAVDTVANKHHAVEEVLWALMVGDAAYASSTFTGFTTDTTDSDITFANSNKSTLGTANLYFVMGGTNSVVYKLTGAVVNEATLDFDIDGLATINWSGFAATITEDSAPTRTLYEDITATDNFIRNRLTQLTITAGDTSVFPGKGIGALTDTTITNGGTGYTSAPTVAFSGGGGSGAAATAIVNAAGVVTGITITATGSSYTSAPTIAFTGGAGSGAAATATIADGIYNLTLTGGSVTISNNMTFITPEELGTVNVPVGHVTGARSVSGNFTCYLNLDTTGGNVGTSTDFYEDLTSAAARAKITNSFATTFKIGGASATPRLELSMPTAHFEIPSHSIDDVISMETNFHGLPVTISDTDELTLKYIGA